jgi:hypothetical protein
MTAGPRRLVLLASVAMLVLAVAACGKKSAVTPPEDEAELYTYPSRYPAPATVRPQAPVEAEEEASERSFLQPFGRSRSTTTTTGPESP